MASNPELRKRILTKVQKVGVARADTLEDLKIYLHMTDVSNTQFGKALRSLCYKYGKVRINRPYEEHHFGPRIYEVSYLPTEALTTAR